MRVAARQSTRMFNAYEISISAIPTCKRNHTIGDRDDRTACGCGIVRCEMCAFRSQYRMHAALRETGTDPGSKLQRRCQDCTFERGAFFIVVGILKQEASIAVTAIHEFRSLDLPIFDEIPVMTGFV